MRLLYAVGLLILAGQVMAADRYAFQSPKQAQSFHELTGQLRCLVCQNQTLADSNSPLALDLKQEIYEQISEGLEADAIMDQMVERYGQFVRYEPPFHWKTAPLWLGPIVLTLIGALVLKRGLTWQ